jgi:hypothetical protein
MNDQMVKECMARINAYSNDEMRMLAKSFGLELLPKVTPSRNKREGYYSGWFKGVRMCTHCELFSTDVWLTMTRLKYRKEYLKEFC